MVGTFGGALEARQIDASDGRLTADVTGEVEAEEGVLVIRRIHVAMRLVAREEVKDTVAAEFSNSFRGTRASWDFSSSTPVPEINDTYPGTSGRTQGERKEISPAKKAAIGSGKLDIVFLQFRLCVPLLQECAGNLNPVFHKLRIREPTRRYRQGSMKSGDLAAAASNALHSFGSGSADAVSTLIVAASALATPFTWT